MYDWPLARGSTVRSPVVAVSAPPVVAEPTVVPSGEVTVGSNESLARTRPSTCLVSLIFATMTPNADALLEVVLIACET